MLKNCFIFLIFHIFFILHSTAYAQKTTSKKIKDQLINANKGISKRIDEVAKGIDERIGGDNIHQANRTQFIFKNQLIWTEGGNFLYRPYLDVRLHFPNIEEKLKLQFSTVEETKGIENSRLQAEPKQTSYGAGIGFFKKLGNISTEFEPRISYQDRVLLSYIIKFKSISETSHKVFVFKPELQLFAKSDTGLGQFLGLNSDFNILERLVLTLINEQQYLDIQNIFSTNHGLVLSYDYTQFVSQNLSYILESSSRPNFHLDKYTVGTAIKHKIIYNILHYTITPFLAFPRHLDFKGSPGISFELELIF